MFNVSNVAIGGNYNTAKRGREKKTNIFYVFYLTFVYNLLAYNFFSAM